MKLAEHPTVTRIRSRQSQAVEVKEEPLDADRLRHLVLEAGADDVGFVEIDRPELADQRDDIKEFFAPTKSLISFVCRMTGSRSAAGRVRWRISNSITPAIT
jgi:hypothetical protein